MIGVIKILDYAGRPTTQGWRSEEFLGFTRGRSGASAVLTDQVEMKEYLATFVIIRFKQTRIFYHYSLSGLVGDRGACTEPLASSPLLWSKSC